MRRSRTLCEVEGYLDLITVLDDRWSLSSAIRDRVALRALALLRGLEQLGDPCGSLFYLKGQTLRTMERYEEAIEPLSLAGDEDPKNLCVWLALGWCYKRTARLDLAIESLEEALAVDPSAAIVYYNLACYWSLANNLQLALDYLAQAFDINPNYRDLVNDERDFDPIRNEPGFQALTGVIV